MFFELLIPPEPFIQDEPHFFCHKFNKIIANFDENGFSSFEKDENFEKDYFSLIYNNFNYSIVLYFIFCKRFVWIKKNILNLFKEHFYG